MKRLVIVLAFLFTPSLCFADDVIQGHYCYTYGDRESLQEARELTRSLTLRNAIESYGVFITSTSNIKNFQITNDLIQMISTGYLKNIKVIEHREEGRSICETIQAKISPQALESIIKEAKGRTHGIEEKGLTNEASEVELMVCSVKDPVPEHGGIRTDISFKLDYTKKTVDGDPANFTDSEIRWRIKFDDGKEYYHILNRYSGLILIGTKESPVEVSGQCSPAAERKF